MSKKLFSDDEIRRLKENPNVLSVTRRVIQYTDEFKIRALNEYNNGKSARKIFSDNGLPEGIIGVNRIRGFFQRSAKASGGTASPKKPRSDAKQIKKLERRITYLQQENEFLKKIQEFGSKI